MSNELEINEGQTQQEEQESLGCFDAYADIVYCIDITRSMAPSIDVVKQTALTLQHDLQAAMQDNYQRTIKQLRVKVIGFRDFYADGNYALETSDFFSLPEQAEEFEQFVNNLEAKGGGDIPESSLEALALAMKSDWCRTIDKSIRRRHIIVLFTDAPAHALEKQTENRPACYPDGMPESYQELVTWWTGQGGLADENSVAMDKAAKRLAVFAPRKIEPWNFVEEDFDNCIMNSIAGDQGGREISTKQLLRVLGETMV